MPFAHTYSAQTTMLSGRIICIEADISRNTLQALAIVGLPDKAVEESRDRVSAAIKNSGFTSPKNKNEKVVVSLAPADLKKEGPTFDLGIALAYLLASGDISFNPDKKLFLGELALDGRLRPTHGTLALALEARRRGFEDLYVPGENAAEAALIDSINVFGVQSLAEVINHLMYDEKRPDTKTNTRITPCPKTRMVYAPPSANTRLEDIKEQRAAKRGLAIAAAGGHNIALWGPPGTGKTMLARALCGVLPPLSFDEAIETTAIHSIAKQLDTALITHPPFRAPHHSSSHVSIIGGGTYPRPGEITLAHNGVLFLDEFPEFDRRVIEALRQPLEERTVSISRVKGSATFPANIILIAAMNPCPCGNFGSHKQCICSPSALQRYRQKISGPIVDRIDMWIEVSHIQHEKLSGKGTTHETELAAARVRTARELQKTRFLQDKRRDGATVKMNSEMNSRALEEHVSLAPNVRGLLNEAAERLDLSPRAYHRVIKLARTIADLDENPRVEEPHILEALQYRPKQVVL